MHVETPQQAEMWGKEYVSCLIFINLKQEKKLTFLTTYRLQFHLVKTIYNLCLVKPEF